MNHIKIEIVANEHQQEELIALLDDYNPTGFEQNEESLIAYFSADDFNRNAVTPILEGYQFTQSQVAEQNWNQEWEQNFQPVVVEDFCAIRAHFHPPIPNVDHQIIITPKMSFGTGHHATTHMMIQQMQQMDFPDKTVFDFGTGTGILAILAQKLGAKSVSAIDVDDWSIENAIENFDRNGYSDIEIKLSTTIPQQSFDIVLANINRNVILQYAPQLQKAVKKGGALLVSGIMVNDEQVINETLEKLQFKMFRKFERSGWLSLLFVNAG